MAFIGRGSLPANYEDFIGSATSALVLPQPRPQYLFAQFAMSGLLTTQALNAGATTVQQYVTAMGNGQPIAPDLDRMMRFADSFPGFFQTIGEFGKGEGDTIKFQRPVYEAGDLTRSARKLNSNSAISTTGRAVKSEEIPVILEEFHGPSKADGDGVKPFAITNFDSKYRANKISLTSLVTNHLTDDYTRWMDAVMRDELRRSKYTTMTVSGADVSAFTAGGNATFSLDKILEARKALTDREWRPFPNGRYTCLVPTVFNTQMVTDVEYRELSKMHGDGRNQLFGYIGSVQDIDFIECTTLKTYADGDVVAGDAGGTVGTDVALTEALLVGPGAVGFGIVAPEPENMLGPVARFADDTNYGTNAKMIWYAIQAMEMLDPRGVQRIIAQTA